MKTKIEKMLNVLVVGGAVLATTHNIHAQERLDAVDSSKLCHLEIRKLRTTDMDMGPEPVQKLCLDDFATDISVDEILEEMKRTDCSTPQCGCWLG